MSSPARARLTPRLLLGASCIALATALATPAKAASYGGMRAAAGLPATAPAAPPPQSTGSSATLPPAQEAARVRQLRNLAGVGDAAALARQAQDAARAAAEAVSPTVPDGLVVGGLNPVANPVPAAQDPTGLNAWQGADAPTQTTSNGHTDVTVHQTQSRAVLSWQTFNVGRDTTLTFDQKEDGAPQHDWVALNRVVGQLDPTTGRRDPNAAPAPSQILGSIKADGTVLVLNQNGILFGATAQVNTHSLVATSLEIGRAVSGGSPLTVKQRNDEFLTYGLLGFADQASISDIPTAFTFSAQSVDGANNDPVLEGAVRVDAGADITVDDGGYILLTGPKIENAGHLSAPQGQVSLVGARQVTLTRSEGKSDSIDPNVRGFVISSVSRDDTLGSYVRNTPTGLIELSEGYVSLGTTNNGAAINEGVILSTTSVSRNGSVRISGGDIRLAPNSVIGITPDESDQTIPQDPVSLEAFKPSNIVIGSAGSRIEIGAGAMIVAPGANVDIGAQPGQTTLSDPGTLTSRIFVDSGAVIDVSGMADVLIPASRNAVKISPVKRNELRDTPNYRDDFLNGATVYVDPRKSGVREDGVAWIGSPLIEAGSFYQQVGVSAAELMTKGGNVTLGVASFTPGGDPALAPDVIVKAGANIDIAGGWVRYEAGAVQETRLIDSAGHVVNISEADPNDYFVGIVGGFTRDQPRWGVSQTWTDPSLSQTHYAVEYTEGRDAGSLTLKGSVIVLDGDVHGDAFAGLNQRVDAVTGTATSSVYGDERALQGAPSQLPAGGLLMIQGAGRNALDVITGAADIDIAASVTPLAADVAYGQSVSVDADGNLIVPERDPASFLPPERRDVIGLSSDALSGMGLSQLTLMTSGKITVEAGSETRLAPGGVFDALAGRAVMVDGAVYVPSGSIAIETANFDIGSVTLPDAPAPGSYDITIRGTLSTRGRWVNDFGAGNDGLVGGAYTDGGEITLVAAPRVTLSAEVASVDDTRHGDAPTENVDISGSIVAADGARLDVSGGGYVAPTGALDLSARGGDLSLVDETTYFQLAEDANKSAGGIEGFRVTTLLIQGVGPAEVPVNPATVNAHIAIAAGTVWGHGFGGGGTFSLTTPEFAFGDGTAATGTELPLDFFSATGFASYNVTSYKTALIPNAFDNGLGGYNAVLATQVLTVGAGQRLNLSQTMFPAVPDADSIASLRGLATGGDLYSLFTPSIPTARWDRRAVNLTLGGALELHVAPGGRIVGEPGAQLTVGGLFNEGTIVLPGGTITQSEILPAVYAVGPALGIHDLSEAFSTDEDGVIHEADPNALGIADLRQRVLTNAQLAEQYSFYLLGDLDAGEGVRLGTGSVTDLSGTSIFNPRAMAQGPGSPRSIHTGRLVAGGTLTSLAGEETGSNIFRDFFGKSDYDAHNPLAVRAPETLVADAGAIIDLSGVAASFDEQNADGDYVLTPEWSDAGTLAMMNGGTLTGALVDAHGGAPAARGGTLIALDPVLYQDDPAEPAPNAISASAVAASGFDTMEALGSVNSVGDVTLTLDRAFFLATRPFGNFPDQDLSNDAARDNLAPVVRSGGAMVVNAPYIRFDSNFQTLSAPAGGTPGTFSATFNADTIDVAGAVGFDASVAAASLNATHDVRLIGVEPYQRFYGDTSADVSNSLGGMLAVDGNLSITAGQVYPTTGSTFYITSAADEGTIVFARAPGEAPATPYSAGGNLVVQAAYIQQGGVVRVPLGQLTLGGTTRLQIRTDTTNNTFAPPTLAVDVTAGSITSVSADGLVIPYGTTTDQTEWYFEPTGANALDAPPAGALSINGADIALDDGATVDIKGGGDIYAYEFVSGTGGSRDELSRFNADAFSSNEGYQYPDGRQVYAIVPGLSDAEIAAYDPIYSSDYADLTGMSNAGMRVYLSAAPGLTAGWYTLLPAKYAMLPGGMRVVTRTDSGGLRPGASQVLKDGTIVTTGYLGETAGNSQSSTLLAFDVQSQSVFRSYSSIAQTFANATFAARAARDGLNAPRLPLDAGRLVLNPTATLAVNTGIDSVPAEGGRGAEADISGQSILIVSSEPETPPPEGTVVFTADSLTNLNAASLLIGGVRTDKADGTTSLSITAQSIDVANDTDHPLGAPAVMLAVDGAGSSIAIEDGAAIVAKGTTTGGGNFVIDGTSHNMTGQGAVVRVANGDARTVTRINQTDADPGVLRVGAATLNGAAILLDSSGDMSVAPLATITAEALALDAGRISFADDPTGIAGLVITPGLQALFGQAGQLSLKTPSTIDFAAGTYAFGDLSLDTPGLRLTDGSEADITADALHLANASGAEGDCTHHCHSGLLNIAAGEIVFGSGTVHTYGFGELVSLSASGGMYVEGQGAFDAGAARLTLDTPFLGDRALALAPGESALLPSLALSSTGHVAIANTAGAGAPQTDGTPGASLTIAGNSIDIEGGDLRATAGVLALTSQTAITVGGNAVLETPGYAHRFGDAADSTDVSAPGGRLSLVAEAGDIDVGAGATLSVGGGAGRAGTLVLSAAQGNVTLDGTVRADAPEGGGALVLDSGAAFDLAAFAETAAGDFGGGIDIRTRTGDLVLAEGDTLSAETVSLTADAGTVDIAGTIDTSGIYGGDVALSGTDGVTLRATSKIDAHAAGYAATDTRTASGGNVSFGTDGIGVITVEDGAAIDVSAARPGDRLVPQLRNGVLYYTYVQGDQGGTLSLRAPIVEQAGGDTVNVAFAGTVSGARSIVLEGSKRFDLATIAADPHFSGVKINARGRAVLDLAASGHGRINFLADDAPGTLVSFVQDFDISASYGTLGGLASSAVFHARPGMELDYSGDIILASNWNLGAGTVDVDGAVAAGLMAPVPSLPGRYYVLPGREADVFTHYTTMVYRTDTDHDGAGNVDGEPGVLTLRAGGTLDLEGSITDGFFQFRDQTDPDYLNIALGGGDQIYDAEMLTRCLNGTCAGVGAWTPGDLPDSAYVSLVIPNSKGLQGLLLNPVPYGAAGNTPAGLGAGPDGSGDALGSAELFPLIDEGDGTHAVASTSYRLIGGADLTGAGGAPSADPTRTVAGARGDVVVEGEHSYTFVGGHGTQTFNDTLLMLAGTQYVTADQWYDAFVAANAGLDQNAYTFIDFSHAPEAVAAFLSAQAPAYFAAFPGEYQLVDSSGTLAGVTTTLAHAADFMRDVLAANFGNLSGEFAPPKPVQVTRDTTAYARTLVRTGTGSIAVAAAGDINLQNGDEVTYRRLDGTDANSNSGLQVGGTAIYTAGAPADLTPRLVVDPDSGVTRTVDPGALASTADVFDTPLPNGYRYGAGAAPDSPGAGYLDVMLANPLYEAGGGDVSLAAGGDVLGRRDVWQQNRIDNYSNGSATFGYIWLGTGDQAWRTGTSDGAPDARIDAQLFDEGVGTLGGGNIRIVAGGNVSDLSVVSTTSVSSAQVSGASEAPTLALATFGGGNVTIQAAGNLLGGRLDVGSGTATVSTEGAIESAGPVRMVLSTTPVANTLRVRLTDATVTLESRLDAELQGITALGVHQPQSPNLVEANLDAYGFYSAHAGVSIVSDGRVTIDNSIGTDARKNPDILVPAITATLFTATAVYPGSFSAASLTGDLDLATGGTNVAGSILLYASPVGTLDLFAGADILPVTIAMEDADPGLLPGVFSSYRATALDGTLTGAPFVFPGVLPSTTDVELAVLHNEAITHLGDAEPSRIFAGGDIETSMTFRSPNRRASAPGATSST